MADFLKVSSLGVSTDNLKTNTLKTHTDQHIVRGRPTLKGTGLSANSIYYGLALRQQHNLQNAVFYEDLLAKIHVLYAHLTYKRTRRPW